MNDETNLDMDADFNHAHPEAQSAPSQRPQPLCNALEPTLALLALGRLARTVWRRWQRGSILRVARGASGGYVSMEPPATRSGNWAPLRERRSLGRDGRRRRRWAPPTATLRPSR